MEDYVIVLTLGGPVMGKLQQTEAGWLLYLPRVLQVVQATHGRTQLQLSPLIGGAGVMLFAREPDRYPVVDDVVMKAYLQSTTNIQIAGPGDMPRNN